MYEKIIGETFFEWKLRLCNAKLDKEIDLEWEDIASILGLDVSADHLRKTAYGLKEYDEYIHNPNGIGTRILCLSDFHIPFQLPISTFKNYVDNVDILVLNGDLLDMQSISKFPKNYRINPIEEMVECRKYLVELIRLINPKKVLITYGNHEKRFGNYLAKHLDNELVELMPDTALDSIVNIGFRHWDKMNGTSVEYAPIKDIFANIDVEYVGDWKVKVGKTWFAHPLAFSQSTLKTTEKAVSYFHNTDTNGFDTVVLAHTHQIGYTKKGNITLIEQGCCCDTNKLNYMDGKLSTPQKQGFVYICQDLDGNLIESKRKLINLN